MNKNEFLEKLEKKLSVLNDKEKQDIVNEYTDTIDEKVKNGQTEEEAVKDFGDINDLSKEILSAYKINPDFDEKEESFLDKSEDLIKEGASKIADMTKKGIDNFKASGGEVKLELVFEIVIKIFIILISLMVLSGVFKIFASIGDSIFRNMFSPVDHIFSGAWHIILVLVYALVIVLLIIAMFKKFFKNSIDETYASNDKKEVSEVDVSGEDLEEDIKETIPKTKKQVNRGSSASDVVLLIVKILVVIYVVFPLVVIAGLSILGFFVSLVYFVRGINLLGLVLLLGGTSSLLITFVKIILGALFGKARTYLIPILASLIMIVVGSFMSIDMVMSIEYRNEAPSTNMAVKTKELTTTQPVYIEHYGSNEITKTINNDLVDGYFEVKITYFEGFGHPQVEVSNNYRFPCDYDDGPYYEDNCSNTLYKYVAINYYDHDDFNRIKKLYNLVVADLKRNEFYNYGKLFDIKIEVVANENTMTLINTNKDTLVLID